MTTAILFASGKSLQEVLNDPLRKPNLDALIAGGAVVATHGVRTTGRLAKLAPDEEVVIRGQTLHGGQGSGVDHLAQAAVQAFN